MIKKILLILLIMGTPLFFLNCDDSDDSDSSNGSSTGTSTGTATGSTSDGSEFNGTWINPSYNDQGCTPCGKLVISGNGTLWAAYENDDDTTAFLDGVEFTDEGPYTGDSTWTQFIQTMSGNYFLLQVEGTTLTYCLDDASYDDAYTTTDMKITFTKQ